MKTAEQTKHTPGPWEAVTARLCEGEYLIVTLDGNTVAKCPSYGVGSVPEGEQAPWHNCKANAQLISAAPDLLQALEIAKATIERLTVRHGPFSSTDGTQSVIDAAIAKATA